MLVDNRQLRTLDGQYQMIPAEGPIAIPLTLDFSNATGQASYTVDLSPYQNMGNKRISIVQTAFIDMSQSGVALTLTDRDSGQQIVANPHTQGYYNILAPTPVVLDIACTNGPNNVYVALINVPIPGTVWAATHP